MPNPNFPTLSNSAADALSDALHALGHRYWKKGSTKDDTPSVFAQWMSTLKNAWDMMERFGGHCFTVSGLNVGVTACSYMMASVEKSFAGSASFALTASATNFLYLDSAGTLQKSTTAWPAGDHFKIAKVSTNATDVTAIVEARLMNFMIGIVNAWATVAASQDVDVNHKALKNVGELWFSAASELTLASDAVTPTEVMHTIDTEGDAAADNLVTLTADAAKVGRLLVLRCENAARVVTVKSTGNIKLKDGDLVLNDVDKFVLLIQHTATQWIAMAWNFMSFGPLTQNLDANNKAISNVGVLALNEGTEGTIAAGVLSVANRSHLYVRGEGGSPDDLKSLTGGVGGQFLILQAVEVITVFDQTASGGVNIKLIKPGSTKVLQSDDFVVLYYDGLFFYEIGRARLRLDDLVGTGQVIPYAIGPAHFTGTPAAGTEYWRAPVVHAFKLKRARGRVRTAPVGGPCTIHVTKNGSSVFATDANAINIADGTQEDVSDDVNVDFAVGDWIGVKHTAVSGAVDPTVSIAAWAEASAVA